MSFYDEFNTERERNLERAAWAEDAVNVFAEATYHGRTFTKTVIEQPNVGEDAYTMIQDLVSNCMHLARKHDWDPADLINRAKFIFEDEEADAEREGNDS